MDEMTYNLTMNDRQYESMVRLLNKIVEQQVEIKESVDDLKTMRKAVVNDIKFDNITLAILLEVSDSTLYRWRHADLPQRIPFVMRKNGTIYYNYDDVLSALIQGTLVARGFNRQKAINNMIRYREDIFLNRGGSRIKSKKQL